MIKSMNPADLLQNLPRRMVPEVKVDRASGAIDTASKSSVSGGAKGKSGGRRGSGGLAGGRDRRDRRSPQGMGGSSRDSPRASPQAMDKINGTQSIIEALPEHVVAVFRERFRVFLCLIYSVHRVACRTKSATPGLAVVCAPNHPTVYPSSFQFLPWTQPANSNCPSHNCPFPVPCRVFDCT